MSERLIATEAGLLTERQVGALFAPCRKAAEWGPGDYRQVIQRGQVAVLTFLTFDWFANSKPCWHAAVAIMDTQHSLKPVVLWDHNDSAAAVTIASELINGAGDSAKGRWARKTKTGLDLYRAPKPPETDLALKIINGMEPLPPFLKTYGLPADIEGLINDGRDQGRRLLTANGSAEANAQGDGSEQTPRTKDRARVLAERIAE